MTEQELLVYIYDSDIFKKWHWYKHHFEHHLRGTSHPFSRSIIRALLDCDKHIPGFAKRMIDPLASISGSEDDRNHYQQLLQRLAELLVIRQVLTYSWSFEAKFKCEPTIAGSKKNPKILVEGGEFPIGIEVKAPGLLDHQAKRSKNPTQLLSRAMPKEVSAELPNADQGITLPRDNPVKDFLISAEAKFSPFRQADTNFRSILVIVWDDHINEPITTLAHPESGLLTPNSFYKSAGGQAVTFPSVDAVIIVRNLHQFASAAGSRRFIDHCKEAMDYGREGNYPPKAIIANPAAQIIPMEFVECFQAYELHPTMGAEYMPGDLTWWMTA